MYVSFHFSRCNHSHLEEGENDTKADLRNGGISHFIVDVDREPYFRAQ